jgi:hypothetical protein
MLAGAAVRDYHPGVDEDICEIRMHGIASADWSIVVLTIYPEWG